MKILVTGVAGFIGYHVARRLAERGDAVVGIDNINSYYDVELKYGRLAELGFSHRAADDADTPVRGTRYDNLRFERMDLAEGERLRELFSAEQFDAVCSLAAQAGVRYSLVHPDAYVHSNVQGFLNILEAARHHPVNHLVYASSSSVYGLDSQVPFKESAPADRPVSLYAASKRSNELTAHSYAHLFAIPVTGLRFFTVYGPWSRPDMAPILFTRAMLSGESIQVFNRGDMSRDFTYIDDIVEGVVRVVDAPPETAPPETALSDAPPSDAPPEVGPSAGIPWRIYNIGNGAPVRLLDFIRVLESELGVSASKEWLPMQPGDVPTTWADCSALEEAVGYRPNTTIEHGVREFVRWYRGFYRM